MDNDHLMTIEELAAFLNLSKHTVYQWRYRDEGPTGFRLGGKGQVRYRKSEVLNWLEGQRDDRPAA